MNNYQLPRGKFSFTAFATVAALACVVAAVSFGQTPTYDCCVNGKIQTLTVAQCQQANGYEVGPPGNAGKPCNPPGCCINDKVVAFTTAQQCQQNGGTVVHGPKVGDACGQSAVKGWCCRGGKVVSSSYGDCKKHGGTFYPYDAKPTNCGKKAGGLGHKDKK